MDTARNSVLSGAVLAVYGLGVLLTLAVGATLVHRSLLLLRERRVHRRRARYDGAVSLLVADELEPLAFLRQVARADQRYIEELLLEYAAKFGPSVHVRLAPVFEGLGAIRRNRRLTYDRRWWQRAEGARRLGLMGYPQVLRVLRPLLKDPHVEVRLAAGRALLHLGTSDWLEDLVETLADPDLLSTLRVADLILEAGQPAVPALIQFTLAGQSDRGVATAIDLLGDMRALDAGPAISHALQTAPGVEVRAAACRALGRLETPEAYELLVTALHDAAWQVRAQAARALGRIGDPAAVPSLAGLLQQAHPWCIYNAAVALASMGQAGVAALRAEAATAGPDSLTARVLGEVLAQEGEVTVP